MRFVKYNFIHKILNTSCAFYNKCIINQKNKTTVQKHIKILDYILLLLQ